MKPRSLWSRSGTALVVPLIVAGCTTTPETLSSNQDLSFFTVGAGKRYFNSDWDPVEDQFDLQITYTYEPEVWPLGIEAGFNWSTTSESLEGSGLSSSTFEVSIGASKTVWPVKDRLLWTFGGGLGLAYSTESLNIFDPGSGQGSSQSAVEQWPGAYVHTRLAWKFSRVLDLGIDLRGFWGGSNVSLVGPVRDGSYVQTTIGLGIHR